MSQEAPDDDTLAAAKAARKAARKAKHGLSVDEQAARKAARKAAKHGLSADEEAARKAARKAAKGAAEEAADVAEAARRRRRLSAQEAAEAARRRRRLSTQDEGSYNTTYKMLCGSVHEDGDHGAPPRGGCSGVCAAARLRRCVVGVLERWDETCALLGRYFPWIEMECETRKNAKSKTSRSRFNFETAETLRPDLRRMIQEVRCAGSSWWVAARRRGVSRGETTIWLARLPDVAAMWFASFERLRWIESDWFEEVCATRSRRRFAGRRRVGDEVDSPGTERSVAHAARRNRSRAAHDVIVAHAVPPRRATALRRRWGRSRWR